MCVYIYVCVCLLNCTKPRNPALSSYALCVAVDVVVYLTLTDPLRIQPWSQDRRNHTKSNRNFCLVHLSRYMPCLCVSPPSGFRSPTLRRPHLASPSAYRICCLLALVHLHSARFPRRCPETGKNSTASGLSLKPITANAVCSLGHRRRPNF